MRCPPPTLTRSGPPSKAANASKSLAATPTSCFLMDKAAPNSPPPCSTGNSARGERRETGIRCGKSPPSAARRELLQLAHPDIPETNRRARIAVRLQLDGRRVVLLVLGLADVERLA